MVLLIFLFLAFDGITDAGVIRTVAGRIPNDFTGDGGPATEARLSAPLGLYVAPDGTIYIADTVDFRILGVF